MKNKLFLTFLSLFLCGAFASAQNTQTPPQGDDDLIVTIIRLSPMEPALYAKHAMPAGIDPKKRLNVIKENLSVAEKNVANASQFIADVEEYLEFAKDEGKEYEEEIPVAKAKLEKWKKIRAAELDGYERLQKEYAETLRQLAKSKIGKAGKSLHKGIAKARRSIKRGKYNLSDDAGKALKASKAGPVKEGDFCAGYGPFAGCVRMGDCSNSCASRKGCWIDNSKHCVTQPYLFRTACWCKK